MWTISETTEDVKERIARRLSDHRVAAGPGRLGKLTIKVERAASRTFTAHWTGFKLLYPDPTLILKAELTDGRFWTEGYVSATQDSWILAFRAAPHKTRGSGGPRPDDANTAPQAIEADEQRQKRWLEAGVKTTEELIRMEDLDDPLEAVDAFFYYTSFYVLKAVNAGWEDIGYEVDPSAGWDEGELRIASMPIDAAIDEGLKKSDIIWVTLDSDPDRRPIPCWYVYTKDQRLFVLSGEPEQTLPGASSARNAHVVTRWKGRDARLAEFDAAVRAITGSDSEEFHRIGELLVNKRQSVQGTAKENISRWMREGVILELTPRA